MEGLRELIKRLDEIESEDLLPEIKGYLMELEKHRKEAGRLEDAKWNVIGKGYSPMEQQALYLTVKERGGGERKLMEGFLEDGKWYGEDGASLKSKRLEVIAWLPKEAPRPYQGAASDPTIGS